MIYAYTGVPGSGKSLHAASDVRWALNHDRPVIANWDLAPEAPVRSRELFRYVPNEEISPGLLMQFADDYWTNSTRDFREDFVTFVADEAQIVWNARSWNDAKRLEWLTFLSQHRKYSYKILLICQSTKMIDNQFRMLIDTEINHRKVSSMGALGFILAAPFHDRLFMRVSYLYQTGERLGSEWATGHKSDMKMYDSYSRLRQVEYSRARA